ncbi:MAG: DNA gyrase subunit B [Lachnospiraceae bacterium]|jgi:DNA gyrase subunit B|nr:DNA gyrase subunit B [Lachnospiraceae bacterium]
MSEEYNGSQIVVLEGLAPVRKRPGMYIGSTGSRGLHHLIWEILDNSIDEHLAGYCDNIDIIKRADGGMTISDNGRGVPVDIHPVKKIPTERVVYTILHAGGKFDNNAYKVSGGLHGVGSSVVNALSRRMIVRIERDGHVYQDEYENGGNPVTSLDSNGNLPAIDTCPKKRTGTTVTFYPDPEIFETLTFKAEVIKKHLRETAYLNKGLHLNFRDEETGEEITFYEEYGIKSYVEYLTRNFEKIMPEPAYITGKEGDIEVEIAFQYVHNYTEQINSYCNCINTVDGGMHVTGFKTALTRVMNQYAREFNILKEKQDNFEGGDIRNGLIAIVSVKHPDPQFEGQTKTKLGNTDARNAVDVVFSTLGQHYFDKNVEILKEILDNVQKSCSARKAGDKARNAVLKSLNEMEVKSKLAACSSRKSSECEVYIVEGDSAGGTVKTARDRRTQAVLPLRGKILNVEKAPLEKILTNNEIRSMINAFGCGIGENFDIGKLRYDKIIILTDADVDGAHISTLLLTFFYRFMPELLKEGKVFRGIPPLYKVDYLVTEGTGPDISDNDTWKAVKPKNARNKRSYVKYLLNDFELEKFRKKKGVKINSLQRYKGLGEMDAAQLWETTLDPDTRVLAEITISDNIEADETTGLLMSNDVPPRRDFIMSEARYATVDL